MNTLRWLSLILVLGLSCVAHGDEADVSNVKQLAESLYEARFKSPNRDLPNAEWKKYLADDLISALEKDRTGDPEDALGFDPFENAQDTWEAFKVQTPMVTDDVASVTVRLSGMGGDQTQGTDVFLQCRKLPDGRWVVADLHYPGGEPLSRQLNGVPAAASQEVARVKAASGIILRRTPGRTGERVGKIPHASTVQVVDRQGPEETIDGVRARWVSVIWQGQSGWVFGGFLEE